jgi:hypothetical protein
MSLFFPKYEGGTEDKTTHCISDLFKFLFSGHTQEVPIHTLLGPWRFFWKKRMSPDVSLVLIENVRGILY